MAMRRQQQAKAAEECRQPGRVAAASDKAVAIPVVEERLRVGKETVEAGRVQVRVTPREEEQVVDLPATEEQVEVERVPVNRVVEAAAGVRQEGDVTIIPIYEERVVVQKQLVLKEEVRLTRRRTTTTRHEQVTLRKEDVTVCRPDDEGPQEKETHGKTGR
jgi:uncharacterized protein (TIGR02271 family)